MARSESNKYTDLYSNPNHPDLKDPHRDLRMLFRKMKPEEENQKPYDFGNVNQAQLAVDGHATRVAAALSSGARRPNYDDKYRNGDVREKVKSNRSQATKPDGWQIYPRGNK